MRNAACSACHCSVSRWIELDDSPEASSPSRSLSAGPKSPVESPCRYRIGSTSVTFGDRRAYAGRIRELNRLRSPVSSSTRLSLTRGARIGTVPDPTVTLRSRARPLRTTSRLPSSSTSSANDADVLVDLGLERRRDHPASALPREIIERDATLVVLPDGEPANIRPWRAFLPAITGVGLHQPGRYAAFLFTRIHNFWV